MDEKRNREGSSPEAQVPNPRDAQGFKENPAPQGLKKPPEIKDGEDSGEWTRGGGTDPNEVDTENAEEAREIARRKRPL